MPIRNRKLRNILAGLIIVLGIISLALVIFASNSYLNLSIQHEREALKEIVDFRAEQILSTLADRQADMGSSLQREVSFRDSYLARDMEQLQQQINQSFHRIFVTGGLLDLKALTVYDNDLVFINQSKGVTSNVNAVHTVHCPDLIAEAKSRTGADRLKVIMHRCVENGKAVQSVLVPIGGLKPLGYLQICTNPAYNLRKLERELAMPIQLELANGDILYESKDWPITASMDQLLIEIDATTSNNKPMLHIHAAQDIASLIFSLKSSRNRILIVSFIIVMMAVLIVLMIMGRALRPLIDLKAAASRIAKGEYTSIKNYSNYEEIATPIESFNKMAADLSKENHSRTLAQEALKLATKDAERLAQKAFEEKKFTQTTLNSIKDGVITSNTDNKVLFMNPAAVKLTGIDPNTAIGHKLEDIFPINAELNQPDSDSNTPPTNQELRLRRADGDEIEIEALASIMYSPDGETIGTVTVFSDVTKQRELTRRLSYAATHDALTGLINRGEFERRLEESIRIAHMDNSEHTLCYMDLDQFKIVNDTCGHIAGDELLRQITSLLRSQVSKRDMLGRLGGDEFGLLMENCALHEAEKVATRLLESIRRYQFVWEDHTFNIGCSIGIVKFDGIGENLTKIMSAADTACYIAKDRGRNRIEVVHAENVDLEKRQGEMQWVLKINTALLEKRFVLYRQLIVPTAGKNSGRTRYEVLIRLKDTDGSIISPGQFLPAAERFNLIGKIDEWVVLTTMQWLQALPKDHKIELSINISGTSITDKKFLEFVVHQIHELDIDPERLCFEITETAAIANLSHAQRFMNIVTGLGCRFALDDFGSGLSSFGYLKSLPVQYLKIDGQFIRNIHRDPVDLAMVKSINDVGHALGLLTVAEFVESNEIIETLKEIKVDYLQGYEIAKPEPLNSPT